MTFSRSLLDRLESPDPATHRELPGNSDEMMDSIHEHLQLMLNSRRGNAQTASDFGTSDFSDFFRGHDSIDILRQEILHSIQTYEPRLRDVQVYFTPREDDPCRIHFEILANIVTDDIEAPALFRTTLESSGEIRISRNA